MTRQRELEITLQHGGYYVRVEYTPWFFNEVNFISVYASREALRRAVETHDYESFWEFNYVPPAGTLGEEAIAAVFDRIDRLNKRKAVRRV